MGRMIRETMTVTIEPSNTTSATDVASIMLGTWPSSTGKDRPILVV
jgi:hypothetical protein